MAAELDDTRKRVLEGAWRVYALKKSFGRRLVASADGLAGEPK